MKCDCRKTLLGFKNWQRLQDAANHIANDDTNGFAGVPATPGVYCIRACREGEIDADKIIASYYRSPLYKAFETLDRASETFFKICGFGAKWGWQSTNKNVQDGIEKRLQNISFTPSGKVGCPILYTGR